MSAQEMIAELPRLTDEERELIAKALQNLEAGGSTDGAMKPLKPRQAELHPGAYVMAADFDEPLPDSFWLGEDA